MSNPGRAAAFSEFVPLATGGLDRPRRCRLSRALPAAAVARVATMHRRDPTPEEMTISKAFDTPAGRVLGRQREGGSGQRRRCRTGRGRPTTRATRSAGWPTTAGATVVGELTQKRQDIQLATYIGSGKVGELQRPRRGDRRRRGHLRQRPRRPAQARNLEKATRGQGARPQRGDPRHLRHPRPDGRVAAAGGTGAARILAAAAQADVDPPVAAEGRRDRAARAGRNAARSRPPARRQPHPRPEAQARRGAGPQGARGEEPRRRSTPSRSSGTRTPASRS